MRSRNTQIRKDIRPYKNQPPRLPWWTAPLLAAVTLVAHGGSLFDGLFFDDYWHRATLRECGWGFDDLVESATFELPGRLVRHWWQDTPLVWRYARPVAMAEMKLELLASGGNPIAIHAFALAWHVAGAVLCALLAAWALRSRLWALVAGVLFAIQPHAVFALGWTAARNAVVSGVLLLAAVWCYLRFAESLAIAGGDSPLQTATQRGRTRWGWLAAALSLWILALFSRETAIIFPLLALGLDVSIDGRRAVWRRGWVYAALAILSGAYLYWRLVVFPTIDPPAIYFTAPHGGAYALWAASKLLQLLAALWFHLPMFLGVATYAGLSRGQLLAHAVLLGLLALIAWWYVGTSRGVRGRWLWPTWIVAAFLPVIPVFIMPHFAYLPAAAISVMWAAMLSGVRRKARVAVAVLIVAGHLWSLGVYRYVWRAVARSEQLIYADMTVNDGPARPGDKLFYLDWPICGIYATVAMREAWGVEDLEGYVLTYAPHPLVMDRSSTIRRVGPRELEVELPAPGYFSGLSGAMLIDGMRSGATLRTGDVVRGDEFDVTILEGDARGVTRLRFTFREPLDSPRYRFYRSSAERPGQRILFVDATGPPRLAPPRAAWEQVASPMLRERGVYFAIVRFVRGIVRSDFYLTGEP
ncbi:MAG: hypothetical protein D6744_09275 [Planctomycetota bacterium]|nr:MAG: hypothetical protein D6744_09275 [Planctomycetota bacterium]